MEAGVFIAFWNLKLSFETLFWSRSHGLPGRIQHVRHQEYLLIVARDSWSFMHISDHDSEITLSTNLHSQLFQAFHDVYSEK